VPASRLGSVESCHFSVLTLPQNAPLPTNFLKESYAISETKHDSMQETVDSLIFRSDTCFPRDESSLPMSRPSASPDKNVRYRQRLRAAGGEEVLFQLPRETVAMLDAIKQRQGLRSRSQALLQLIEQKGAATQQTT
jgi:hypothetical protein